ncbi:MAG: pantetheine-phosphate adenylyltransferase [Oscillospiraceae bacterium]
MITAIYPGSFDPITLGHLDIIKRAAGIFDKLVVSVVANPEKKPLFEIDERIEIIKRVVSIYPNVEVDYSIELLAEYAKKYENPIIIKGLRNLMDYEYETTMAVFNKKLNPELETFLITASQEFTYISSTAVKQLGMYGVDLSDYIPSEIAEEVLEKFRTGGKV